jgi:hypothetical protein
MVVSGRVLHGGTGGAPLARAWVVLHRIAMRGGGGPIDSVRTDPRGRFTLTVARPDTGAVYVVSCWYHGIAYFSEPAAAVPPRSTTDLRPLLVYDTTSAGPGVQVARRLVTVATPKPDGTRDVLELVELRNPGEKTRIGPDTTRPTWTGAIPRGALEFQAGEGDLSAQAVALRGDSVAVFGPIPPGEPKQLSYTYVLPSTFTELALPIDQSIDEVDLLLEDVTATVTARSLDTLGVQAVEGRRFASYRARAVAAGSVMTIALPQRRGFRAESLVPIVVILAGVALAVGFAVALRKKTSDVRHQTA